MSCGTAFEQDDVVYNLTITTNVSEAKLQRVLDSRFPGSFIHMRKASPNAQRRWRKNLRVGRLSVPPEIVQRRKALTRAANDANATLEFDLGPYQTSIQLYRKPLSEKEQLEIKNEELQQQLDELLMRFKNLQNEKRSDEMLLEHVIESHPITSQPVSNGFLSSDKKRTNTLSPKRKASVKKRKKEPQSTRIDYGALEKQIIERNLTKPPQEQYDDPVKRRLDTFLQNMQGT